jgi:acyl carrier protein
MAAHRTDLPDIAALVRERFAEIMGLPAARIDMAANLYDRYGVDSLNSLRLIAELEMDLGVEIPEERLAGVLTLNDVVALCAERVAGRR